MSHVKKAAVLGGAIPQLLVVLGMLTVLTSDGADTLAPPFRNLNFEWAQYHRINPGSPLPEVDPNAAFRFWTLEAVPDDPHMHFFTLWNEITIGSPAINIITRDGPGGGWIEGNHSALLQNGVGRNIEVRLSQRGQIPGATMSINFLSASWGRGAVLIDEEPISLVKVGDRWWGDVSQYAGLSVDLSFRGTMFIDDIQFSPIVIPEPSAICLAGIALIVGVSRSRRARSAAAE